MAIMTADDIQEVKDKLSHQIFGLGCSVYATNVGLLVSGINTDKSYEEASQDVIDLVFDDLAKRSQMIYRLFLYKSHTDEFKTEATLYTKASDVQGGMRTTYRQATDADILMREIDFTYLSLGNAPSFELEVQNADKTNQMVDGRKYGELFAMGDSFGPVTAKKRGQKWFLVF